MTQHPIEPVVGYCTNVHAGTDLKKVQQNLQDYSLHVKDRVRPDSSMGIGLWLSHEACRDLLQQAELQHFANWIAERQLLPFTFNGFPYANFHQPVVKHQVYQPDWSRPERFEYTRHLAHIQRRLLEAQSESTQFATISTLPLGWPVAEGDHADFQQECAQQLIRLSEELDQIFDQSGIRIMVCLEPEPGCILDTAADVGRFFDQFLFSDDQAVTERIRRHIGVCHDVCHSSVMFESQDIALEQYETLDIEVGKYQISSAIEANFNLCPNEPDALALLRQLTNFSEPRYLHQTMVQHTDGRMEFHEDLPIAIEQAGQQPQGRWRVHFHVPLFADKLGRVATTQSDVQRCLDSIRHPVDRPLHFELETYAWTVLPEALQVPLAVGISQEMEWFDKLLR